MVGTKIIDGATIAKRQRGMLRTLVDQLYKGHGLIPGLAVVLVGDDPASQIYVGKKKQACEEVGIKPFERRLPADISQDELLMEIASLNENKDVHGILVQLPLPEHIEPDAIINAIAPHKDVDGFHPENIGRLWLGQPALAPCTPTGCITLIRDCVDTLAGKHAVIIGRSNIVGKPMAALLLNESCTVVITHSKTKNLEALVGQADIVIAAAGKPQMVQGSWLKEGAVVIDVGINRIEDENGEKKLVGDVDFESCMGIASAITPVPGGVGPMTVAFLLQNTVRAAVKIAEYIPPAKGDAD